MLTADQMTAKETVLFIESLEELLTSLIDDMTVGPDGLGLGRALQAPDLHGKTYSYDDKR